MKHGRHAQQGFAAIAAIFLVVVLAALGAFMVTFSNTQQLTAAQDVQGSRAYWAARAGLEWGVASAAACPATSGATLSTTLPQAIDAFAVVVTCTRQTYTEASPTPNVNILQFKAVANSAGSPGNIGYIERSLSVSIEQ
jgi:MSHA biogenesis protein MshP